MNRNPLAGLEDLTERLSRLLPPGAEQLREDVRRNLKSLLATTLERMDLVTREEFDLQRTLLARTRARLEELERRVAELEAGPGPTPGG